MDYFGQVVNRSSRVCSSAYPGEIAMSAASQQLMSNSSMLLYKFQSTGQVELKGVRQPIEIFSVMPQELAGRLDIFSAGDRMANISGLGSALSAAGMSAMLSSSTAVEVIDTNEFTTSG